MDVLTKSFRLLRSTKNWYEILLYHAGLKKRVILKTRKGVSFLYIPGFFNLEHICEEPYRHVNVWGKDVIDVGAFNGDSAIYFSLKGARKVYAFEPFPMCFEIARQNIKINGITNIVLFNQGLGAKEKYVRIDPQYKSSTNSSIREFAHGKPVLIRTLKSIVNELQLKDAVLKLDCEGCEYEVLAHSECDVLYAFTEIIVEYHYKGYEMLVKKLVQCGFKVKYLKGNGEIVEGAVPDLGMILATRN